MTARESSSQPRSHWFPLAWVDGGLAREVRIDVDASGTISAVTTGVPAPADVLVHAGLALPGAVNAHSHAFHRLLRGRTHGDGGTFWTWREHMYDIAGKLTPDAYYLVARAVYAEMATAGYTAVGEFHYVHHAQDAAAYPHHDMEFALARAAIDVGIRLVLLDACYLTGGPGAPLEAQQERFGDGSIHGYQQRHESLCQAFADQASPVVTLGAAIHSVRAVPPEALPAFAQLEGPLHIHLSEQPAENEAALEHWGRTPTALLADAGLLTERLSAVHATHLTDSDIDALGTAGTSIVMCPTTEADLADGIGPARALADAGATIALGSDQHVALDPLLELRGLEAGERLGSGQRGRFSPAELIEALTTGGARSLGLASGLAVGAPADFFVLSTDSARTIGSRPDQAPLAATAVDVTAVVVNGAVVARNGEHETLGPVNDLYREALAALAAVGESPTGAPGDAGSAPGPSHG